QSDAEWNVLNMLNARYVIGMDGSPLYNPEAYGNAWLVDSLVVVSTPDAEMAALSEINPRLTAVTDRQFAQMLGTVTPPAPGDTIYETTYAPDRLTYRARTARGATAVFSEVYFPWGWKATVDGEETPIARVDYLLRAITLPAGDHEVVMTFSPVSVKRADTLATVSVILIYLSVLGALGLALRKYLASRPKPASK
ncbi:MAG: YfhO family protein, partial [Duncaniella sp.]|nr:YfhO family protein [Duncaniella sp.]